MLYAKTFDTVWNSGGNTQDTVQIEEAMRQVEFEGMSGWVSLGGLLMSHITSCCVTSCKSADDNGDRILDVDFLNVVAEDQWPRVATYNMTVANLTLMENITWIGGSTTKVMLPFNICLCFKVIDVLYVANRNPP